MALLFRSHLYACDGIDHVLLRNALLATTYRQNSGFIHHVFKVCTCAVGHALGNVFKVDILVKCLATLMHFENVHATFKVGIVDCYLAVKTTWTKKRRIQNITTVGCRHDDHAFIHRKTVHLNKQLIERLFTFIMSATQTCATLTTHGIDFVNEDDRWRGFLRLFKQITHTACAHTYEHFHKV